MKLKLKLLALLVAPALALGATQAVAQDLKVGVTVSATGPAASLGIPERNTFALVPQTIGGRKVQYIILDDASDTTSAVKNTRKLISEDKVDVIVGSTVTPNSLAMIDVVAEAETPMISMASSASIVEPQDAKRRWVFKNAQSDTHMATAIIEHMNSAGLKRMAFIGFADAYGEGWWKEISKLAEVRRIEVIAHERFNRTDTSVTGQALKIISAKPDVVMIAGAGTPAALPQKTLREKGYKGPIYQTHGVANSDFLRIGGKDVEGTLLPAGPVLVAAQLPDGNPVKKVALDYVTRYEALHGKGSATTFGAHSWDAGILLSTTVPQALKKAQPGTKEFRAALRDALEGVRETVGAHGVYNMRPQDHVGLDQRSRVMVRIVNGGWKLER